MPVTDIEFDCTVGFGFGEVMVSGGAVSDGSGVGVVVAGGEEGETLCGGVSVSLASSSGAATD